MLAVLLREVSVSWPLSLPSAPSAKPCSDCASDCSLASWQYYDGGSGRDGMPAEIFDELFLFFGEYLDFWNFLVTVAFWEATNRRLPAVDWIEGESPDFAAPRSAAAAAILCFLPL